MKFDLTDFFYNFVPGVITLLVWYLLFNGVPQDPAMINPSTGIILIITVLGLALGFLLQAVWIIIGRLIFDQIVVYKFTKINREQFNFKNRWLWKYGKQNLPEYFSCRNAFWGNISTASLFTIILLITMEQYYYSLVAIGVLGLSLIFYSHYKIKQINTVNDLVTRKDLEKY